jgi:flagellar biosynthetic protein FlhB
MSDPSGEDRTLEPTARRIERMRRAGQVAFSRELVSGFVVAAACLVLATGGKAAVGHLLAYIRTALASACRATPPGQAMRMAVDAAGAVLALPLGIVCAVALLMGLVQSRGNLAGASRRAPHGLFMLRPGRMLGRESAADLLLDLCKLCLVGAVVSWVFLPCLAAALGLPGAGASRILIALGSLAKRLALSLALALAGLGIADYLLQNRRHRLRLRMTRDEAKREQRESEGDPEYKAERQRRHREWQMESRDLREATLVVVAPGKVAVAIGYSGETDEAPLLVAKGADLLARKVETLAQLAGAPVFIDAELALTCFGVEVGDEIPENTYPRVAELMVQVRRWSGAEGTSLPERPAP